MLADLPLINIPAPISAAACIGLVFVALASIAGVLVLGMQVWDRLRTPAEKYITRAEFEALKQEIEINRSTSERHFSEIASQLSTLQKTMSANNGDIMRAIGRLEGRTTTP